MKSPPLIDRGEPELDIDALIASAQEASGFLKALAHEGRLLILCLLVEEEKSVTEIEEILGCANRRFRSSWRGCAPTGCCRRGVRARTFSIR